METEKNKGGRKKKPANLKKKVHPIYATDDEWAKVMELAEQAGSEISPFIIKKVLS